MEKAKKTKKKELLIGLVVGIFVSILSGCNLLDGLEWMMYDMKFHFRGELAPEPKIVIVVVDEQSLNEIGRWPWNRKYHAELIDKLSLAGARTIGIDILFVEPNIEDSSQDRRLIEATKAFGGVVYLVTWSSIGG